MHITKIFLDMDGVIVDFVGGVLKKFGIEGVSDPHSWEFNYEQDFGCSFKEFWNSLNDPFWESLEFSKEASGVFTALSDRGLMSKVCVLSHPPSEIGFLGKATWIKKNLPQLYHGKQFLLGRNKMWCAHPNALLIDDYERYCRGFVEAGGNAFLFPRPWNRCRDLEYRAVEELEEFLDSIRLRG